MSADTLTRSTVATFCCVVKLVFEGERRVWLFFAIIVINLSEHWSLLVSNVLHVGTYSPTLGSNREDVECKKSRLHSQARHCK